MPKLSKSEWVRLKRRQDILNGELVVRRPAPTDFIGRILLVFPDDYGIGVSNLGYQYVRLLFEEQGFFVDRFFLDPSLPDDRSLEHEIPLDKFDLIAISLSFESSVEKLVPFLKRLKGFKRRPYLVLGGSITYFNPFMILDFVDFVILGDGEIGIPAFARWYLQNFAGEKPPWIMVPGEKSGVVAKAFRLEFPAFTSIIPAGGPFEKFFLLEIGRGCPVGCRFCVYGYTYRPVRWFSVEQLRSYVSLIPKDVEAVGLVSASLSLHPEALEVAEIFLNHGFRVVPSSLHVNESSPDLIEILMRGGLRSLTFAVEHGDPDVQLKLGKRVDALHLRRLVGIGKKFGMRRVKLYFIMGIGDDPVDSANAGIRFLRESFGGEHEDVEVVLSFSIFVPKPWTPFEDLPFPSKRDIAAEIRAWRRRLAKLSLRVIAEWPSWRDALKEYVISRATAEQVELLQSGRLSYRGATGIVASNAQWKALRHIDPYGVLYWEKQLASERKPPLGCLGECDKCMVKSIRRDVGPRGG